MIIKDPLLTKILNELGIPSCYPIERGLIRHPQPKLSELVVADIDYEGKPLVLTKTVSRAWKTLSVSAFKDGITLQPFSGFRSYLYQRNLIKRQLDNGKSLEEILRILAAPGYSEHHTGCAIDLTTPGCKPLTEELELTPAFEWLTKNAGNFNFTLSFPRNNKFGFIYEPWHWRYTKIS